MSGCGCGRQSPEVDSSQSQGYPEGFYFTLFHLFVYFGLLVMASLLYGIHGLGDLEEVLAF